jgi:uncharacterized protein (DUF608 family)
MEKKHFPERGPLVGQSDKTRTRKKENNKMGSETESRNSSDSTRNERSRTTYSDGELTNIAFPIGGIGTGCVSFGGWGQLRDWEIFNHPAKGNNLNFTFFTVFAKPQGGHPIAKVLQGPMRGPLTGNGSGTHGRDIGAGLPHFRSNTFTGEYPFGLVDLDDPSFPLDVSVEAFNPFIPLDDFNSSLPAAIFLIHMRNPEREKTSVILYANLENRVGHPEVGQNTNTSRKGRAVTGLMMTSNKYSPDSPRYGSMALTTTHRRLSIIRSWPRLKWFDNLTWFWDIVSRGKLPEQQEDSPTENGKTDIGTIAAKATLKPGEFMTIPIIITWHFPNNDSCWPECSVRHTWRNYYSTRFEDAWEVADYVGKNLQSLEKRSRAFQESLFDSSYPASVIDAVGSQISILKTPTCLRTTDGSFWAWEGCCDQTGCCAGTCSHVWNYAQAMAYLFPALERSARNTDYNHGLRKDGGMIFRASLPLDKQTKRKIPPAADGQMGNILRFYRDWRICGDDDWLREMWPKVKKSLEFAWQQWDADKDGVMEGVQHNTYDIEFYGPNTMMGSLYLAALSAAAEMAKYLGAHQKAEEYRHVRDSGRQWMDKHLFNGEWYQQEVIVRTPTDAVDAKRLSLDPESIPESGRTPKYQYAGGCLSDQLIGQWYAYMLGLGELFSKSNMKKTAKSIFRYNFRRSFYDHPNVQRIYAQDGDSGTLLCSWPRGRKPEFPFPYSNEVWTGIEYAAASLLIYSGLVDEALEIVKAARDRHDGARRNPWDEYECGHHYARAMSSYSLLLALSGFQYSAPELRIEFAPRTSGNRFRTFFSVASAWGTWSQRITPKSFSSKIEISEGKLELKTIGVAVPMGKTATTFLSVTAGGKQVKAGLRKNGANAQICFAEPVTTKPGSPLEINLKFEQQRPEPECHKTHLEE